MTSPNRLLSFLLFLPLFGVLPAAGAEPPVFSVVPGAGTTATPAGAVYTFSVPRLLSDDTPLTHTFLVRSSARKPLTFVRVAASCECIQAEIGGSGRLPVKAAPGAVVPVEVRLSPDRLLPGPFSKSVWLYWRGGSRDGLRLELRGTVRDASCSAPAVSGAGASAH